MALPKRITIHELGPREGMQIEKEPDRDRGEDPPGRPAVRMRLSTRSR